MQDRLHDCRAGELSNTLQPILPQNPNYQGASWDCGHLWQSGCQNLYRGRGLQNSGGILKGAKIGFPAILKKCRGRFSRTYSPCRHQRWTPLAPPHRRSSLADTQDLPTFPYLLASRPGLPLRLSVTAKRRNSTQGRSKLVAAWQGYHTGRSAPAGTFTIIGKHL